MTTKLSMTDRIEQAKIEAKTFATDDIIARITSNGRMSSKEEAKLKVKCVSTRSDYEIELRRILDAPLEHRLILSEIVKNPTKQNIQEIIQFAGIKETLARISPAAQHIKPTGGGRMGFNEEGEVSGFLAKGTKDIDFHITGIGTKDIYGGLKYITARGGAQDHQANEVLHTMRLAAKKDNIFIAIIDGRASGTYIRDLSKYTSRNVFVTDSEGLEPLLLTLASN
jgi:hypothetical protein